MSFSKLRHVFMAVTLLSALTPSVAQSVDKIIFARSAPWGIVDAPLSYAIDLGFFKSEHIDTNFVVVGGSYAALQQILSGASSTGFVPNEAIPTALQPGKTAIPLRMVYNYYRNFPVFEIVVPANSSIKKLSELKGKKIGVLSLAAGNVPITKAALSISGLQSGDYTLLPVGVGAQATQALRSGQVDALNLWHTVHAQIDDSGLELRRIPFPSEFESFPSTGIGFTEDFIKSKPDLIARFGRALTKGSIACQANPAGCIRAFWRQNPALKPAGDENKSMESALKILNVGFTRLTPPSGLVYGAYSKNDWGNLLKAFEIGGVFATRNVPLELVYTNQFVAEYNKFDRAAVEKAAKNSP